MNILLNKKFKRIEPEAVVLIEGSPLPKYTICIPILARVNIQQMLTEIVSAAKNIFSQDFPPLASAATVPQGPESATLPQGPSYSHRHSDSHSATGDELPVVGPGASS